MSRAAPVAFGLALEGDLPAGVRFHWTTQRPPRAVRLQRVERTAAQDPPALAIALQADGSHRLSAPGCGACVVAGDGRAVTYAPAAAGVAEPHRLLLDQALPFAACAAGLECLHASAVACNGRAIALAGVSGTGKSTLAHALARRGAEPLADDVLALETDADGGLLAHAALPRRRLQARLETLAAVGPVTPLPLGALYLLDRRPAERGAPRFEPISDPRLVLACTFNFVLATPARLARLLELCHRLAARTHLRRAIVPGDADASALADAIGADLAEADTRSAAMTADDLAGPS
ncbi:MAG TPA: hypothetical protein VFG31_05090 [Conexibacter sp.]|nr:hypothetical protein [Conexibacter sp.]